MFHIYTVYQADNPTTALCPGMRCRTVYDNLLSVCVRVPGVSRSSLEVVSGALVAVDGVAW